MVSNWNLLGRYSAEWFLGQYTSGSIGRNGELIF